MLYAYNSGLLFELTSRGEILFFSDYYGILLPLRYCQFVREKIMFNGTEILIYEVLDNCLMGKHSL